jgi:hypothetical protein
MYLDILGTLSPIKYPPFPLAVNPNGYNGSLHGEAKMSIYLTVFLTPLQ